MLTELLVRPIAFHRVFAEIGGSIAAGLFLSQAFYWSKTKPDGWFYKTQEEWTQETMLTRFEQESARKKLRSSGVLQEERRSIPAKLYFRVDQARLEALVTQVLQNQQIAENQQTSPQPANQPAENLQSSLLKSSNQECQKPAIKCDEKSQSITEITTETSSEITTENHEQVATQPGGDAPRAKGTGSYINLLVDAWIRAYVAWHPEQTRPADAEDFAKNGKRLQTLVKALRWCPLPAYFEQIAGRYLADPRTQRHTLADLCSRFADLEIPDQIAWDHNATLAEAIVLNASGYPCNLNARPTRMIPSAELPQIRKAADEMKTRLNGYSLEWLKTHGLTSRDLLAFVFGERDGKRLRPENIAQQYDLLIRQRRNEGRLTPDEFQHLTGANDDDLNSRLAIGTTDNRKQKPGIAERYERTLSEPIPPEWGGDPIAWARRHSESEAGEIHRTPQGRRTDARRLSA